VPVRLDAGDRLVLIGLVGVAMVLRGVYMLSSAAAWILFGVALMAWAVWRLTK
jgi:hypothetical protein